MDFTNIIISTYATEKTHKAQTNDVAPKYSFIVAMKASKEQILLAFQSLYGVRATNISTQIRKSVRVKKGTDKPGFSQAFKIAHISLEKGLKLNMTEEELTKWEEQRKSKIQTAKEKNKISHPKQTSAKKVEKKAKKIEKKNKKYEDKTKPKKEHEVEFSNITKKLRVKKIENEEEKITSNLVKQKEPYIIVSSTDKGNLVLKSGEIVTKKYVISEIDENDQPFALKTKNNLLITVHPKADIVDYVRTKPNKASHDNLSESEVVKEDSKK